MRVLAVKLFRLSHWVGKRVPLLGLLVKQLNHAITGADIGYGAQIGPGLDIPHPGGVVITPHAVIGARCRLHSCVTIGGNPILGDDVYIGAGARIIGDTKIGDRVQIGANAVVFGEYGSDLTLVGVPARVVERATH